MARKGPRFAAIPSIPQTGLTDWQFFTLQALKEDVELLIGARGEKDRASQAVVKGALSVDAPPNQTMQRVTADGSGFAVNAPEMTATGATISVLTGVNLTIDFTAQTFSLTGTNAFVPTDTDYGKLITDVANTRGSINGIRVPNLDDYSKLLTNVQSLANDVAALRATVNTLIQQLKN